MKKHRKAILNIFIEAIVFLAATIFCGVMIMLVRERDNAFSSLEIMVVKLYAGMIVIIAISYMVKTYKEVGIKKTTKYVALTGAAGIVLLLMAITFYERREIGSCKIPVDRFYVIEVNQNKVGNEWRRNCYPPRSYEKKWWRLTEGEIKPDGGAYVYEMCHSSTFITYPVENGDDFVNKLSRL